MLAGGLSAVLPRVVSSQVCRPLPDALFREVACCHGHASVATRTMCNTRGIGSRSTVNLRGTGRTQTAARTRSTQHTRRHCAGCLVGWWGRCNAARRRGTETCRENAKGRACVRRVVLQKRQRGRDACSNTAQGGMLAQTQPKVSCDAPSKSPQQPGHNSKGGARR